MQTRRSGPRFAATLDLLRRATDKPGCRYDRDWSRPSLDMLLPEVPAMRRAAQLLAVAARQAAADGKGAQALADLSDVARASSTMELLRSVSDAPKATPFDGPLSLLYRSFMLPADITGSRAVMRRYQAVVGTTTEPPPKPYPQVVKEMTAMENDLESCRPGVFAALLAPGLAGVVRSQSKGEALHDVAGVLVTAGRCRPARIRPRATTTSASGWPSDQPLSSPKG